MKRGLLYKPRSNLLGEMREKVIKKERKKEKVEKKKEVVEVDDTVMVEDKHPDIDEEPMDRKRKREIATSGVDAFNGNVSMHFPAGASIIQESKKYLIELKKIVLKEDSEYIRRMKIPQIQERTITHLDETLQATVIYDELCTMKANRAKAAKKENEKMRVEYGEKIKNLEEKIKILKKKAEEYDVLEATKESLEVSLAAAHKEIGDLKSEKAAVEIERDKLLESVKDAHMLGRLAIEEHLMKEFLKHGAGIRRLKLKSLPSI